MTLSVDASSPAVAQSSGATTSTAAYSPPGNSLLIALVQADANTGALDEALTVSGTGQTWSRVAQHNGNGGAVAEIWKCKLSSAPGSITTDLTDNKGSVAKRLFVRVFTDDGGSTPDTGATITGTTASVSYTSTIANSWGWSCGLTSNATVTAGSGCTLQDETGGFDGGDAVFTIDRTATTATPGTSVTLTESGGTVVHHVAVEIVPPGAAAPTLPLAVPRRRPTPPPSRARSATTRMVPASIPPPTARTVPRRPRPGVPAHARLSAPPPTATAPPPPGARSKPRPVAAASRARRGIAAPGMDVPAGRPAVPRRTPAAARRSRTELLPPPQVVLTPPVLPLPGRRPRPIPSLGRRPRQFALVIAHVCVISRPYAGTTVRPSTGVVGRPDTGTVPFRC